MLIGSVVFETIWKIGSPRSGTQAVSVGIDWASSLHQGMKFANWKLQLES